MAQVDTMIAKAIVASLSKIYATLHPSQAELRDQVVHASHNGHMVKLDEQICSPSFMKRSGEREDGECKRDGD